MPKTIDIGKENSTFQHFEALRCNRTKRHQSQEFIVEGVRAINNALEYSWKINGALYSEKGKLSGWAKEVLEKVGPVTQYRLTPTLLKKISNKKETSELLLLIAMPEDDLSRIPITDDFLLVVLDRPVYPGNIGTIIRSADALNVNGVVITGHAADLYDQDVVNASTGSLFSVPTVRLQSHKTLFKWLAEVQKKQPSLQIVGTDEKGEKLVNEVNLMSPTALIFGNETAGMSEAYKEACDTIIRIPIKGAASSLNIGNAASIMLYEVERQRHLS